MTKPSITRRGFLAQGIAGAAAMGVAGTKTASQVRGASSGAKRFRKATQLSRVKPGNTAEEKLKITQDVGFEGLEINATTNQNHIDELRAASEKTGVPIHSVVCSTHWRLPLSDPDPARLKKGIEGMKTAIRNARDVKASNVLLVPAVVKPDVTYKQAYERSQKHIRSLLPMAEEHKVTISIENVWNKFLLSPLEFARYIDELGSKYARAYFDIGNVVIYGYPQDWIRTLGPRIERIHLKDFKRAGYKWSPLLEGDVNWPECMKALKEVGYEGWLTTEVGGGDHAALKDLSQRVDKILSYA